MKYFSKFLSYFEEIRKKNQIKNFVSLIKYKSYKCLIEYPEINLYLKKEYTYTP